MTLVVLLLWADVISLFFCSVWRPRCPSRVRQDTVWGSWPWAAAPWYLRGQSRASCLSNNQMLHHLHNLRYIVLSCADDLSVAWIQWHCHINLENLKNKPKVTEKNLVWYVTYHLFQLQKTEAVLLVVRWLWCALTEIMKLWLRLPFSLSSFFRLPPLSVCFLLTLCLILPLGISSTAYRWASAADSRWWPRWAKAALPREESGCSIPLQTETQTVGQFPGEEGWGALQPECLAVGEWAQSGWAGMKRGLWEACVNVSHWLHLVERL